MCNLYSMLSTQAAMRALAKIERDLLGNQPRLPGIFPGYEAPVVRIAEDGGRELVAMRWGFPMHLRGAAEPKLVNNARWDKVLVSRLWLESFELRRALILLTSFAESDGRRPATWHWFALKDAPDTAGTDAARPLIAAGGFWRRWRGRLKGELVDITVYTMMTVPPNADVAPIHDKAMPLILDPEHHDTWLHGSAKEAHALARPYPDGRLAIVQRGGKEDRGGAPAQGTLI